MPSKRSGLATKKELNRYKKAELIKYIKAKNLPCNTKMSKRELVNCAFKHKELRAELSKNIPSKRKMSEKQLANLKKWKVGSDYKNETKIKPKAQYVAELKKIEDTEQKPGRSTPITTELKMKNAVVKKQEEVRAEELQESTTKMNDVVEQAIKDKGEKPIKQRVILSEQSAKNRHDKRFGEGDFGGLDMTALLDESGKLDIAKIKAMRQQVLVQNPKHPQAQSLMVLELLAERAKERGNQTLNIQNIQNVFPGGNGGGQPPRPGGNGGGRPPILGRDGRGLPPPPRPPIAIPIEEVEEKKEGDEGDLSSQRLRPKKKRRGTRDE